MFTDSKAVLGSLRELLIIYCLCIYYGIYYISYIYIYITYTCIFMDLDGLVEGFLWILFKGLKRYTIACLRKRIYNLVIYLHMHLQIFDKLCMLHGHASMYM